MAMAKEISTVTNPIQTADQRQPVHHSSYPADVLWHLYISQMQDGLTLIWGMCPTLVCVCILPNIPCKHHNYATGNVCNVCMYVCM